MVSLLFVEKTTLPTLNHFCTFVKKSVGLTKLKRRVWWGFKKDTFYSSGNGSMQELTAAMLRSQEEAGSLSVKLYYEEYYYMLNRKKERNQLLGDILMVLDHTKHIFFWISVMLANKSFWLKKN